MLGAKMVILKVVRLKSPNCYILGEYKQQVRDNNTFIKENIRWKLPAMGWVRLNMNGATRGNSVSDCVRIFCNDRGE